MAFVCVAHFGFSYFALNGAHRAEWAFYAIGRIASPTFMLISGVVLGFLYALHRGEFAVLRDRLIDRGIFLLTITHVLIAGAHAAVPGGIPIALLSGVITDTIGFNLILGALLITRTSPSRRVLISAIVYAAAWTLVFVWQPRATWLEVVKQVLIGSTRVLDTTWDFDCPLVPWFAFYFAASTLGERLGMLHLAGDPARMKTLVTRLAAGGMACGAGFGALLLAGGRWMPATISVLDVLRSPMQKNPPSPAYFALYGGIGLLMLRVFLEIDRTESAGVEIATMVGQTSLFAFVIEYYVYFSVLYPLHLGYAFAWPLYFATSVAVVAAACALWRRQGYNRLLTVGYPGR
jgi:hypothetical protein